MASHNGQPLRTKKLHAGKMRGTHTQTQNWLCKRKQHSLHLEKLHAVRTLHGMHRETLAYTKLV